MYQSHHMIEAATKLREAGMSHKQTGAVLVALSREALAIV